MVEGTEHSFDKAWVLTLYDGKTQLGNIGLFWDKGSKTIKPDGLEVPDRGNRERGYGNVLAKYAVRATELGFVRDVTGGAQKVYINCVNPLSAALSVKELVSRLNGSDTTCPEAEALAKECVADFESQERLSKYGYNVGRFAGFWGRVVYLATEKGGTFETPKFRIDGDSRVDKELTCTALEYFADARITGKPGTFVFNISVPIGG